MHRRASQVALIYAVLAAAWIVVTDAAVSRLPMSIAIPLEFAKGLAFVGATALALYWVVLRISEHGDDEMHRIAGAERLLTQVLDTSPIGIFLLNDEGHITYMNHGAEELTSSKAAVWVGRHFDELRSSTDGEIGLANLVNTGYSEGIRIGPPDSIRTVVARSAPVDSLHPEAGTVLVLLDVTDAELAEKHASRTVGAYGFLAAATSALARANDEGQMIDELTALTAKMNGFSAAWALAKRGSGEPQVVARSGLRERAVEVSARLAREYAEGKLDRETDELRSGVILVRNDLAHDPTNPWYVAADAEGLAASATLGVLAANGSTVSLTLFAATPGFFDAEMVEALQGLRAEIAFAVERLALERRRLEAEEETGKREEAYRRLFESNPQPMWVYAADTLRFLAVNDAAISKYCHTREEFLGMTIADIRPDREVARLRDRVGYRAEGFSDEGLWTHRDGEGREFPVHVYSHGIEWEGCPAQLVMALEVARME